MYCTTKYYPENELKSQSWFKNNNDKHNENGPAIIEYYQNGNIMEIHYWVNNKRHNENGPAYVGYYKHGKVKYYLYYLNDSLHNTNGPAIFIYDRYGNINNEKWYYKNFECTDEVNEWLNMNNIDYENSHMNFNRMWFEIL